MAKQVGELVIKVMNDALGALPAEKFVTSKKLRAWTIYIFFFVLFPSRQLRGKGFVINLNFGECRVNFGSCIQYIQISMSRKYSFLFLHRIFIFLVWLPLPGSFYHVKHVNYEMLGLYINTKCFQDALQQCLSEKNKQQNLCRGVKSVHTNEVDFLSTYWFFWGTTERSGTCIPKYNGWSSALAHWWT